MSICITVAVPRSCDADRPGLSIGGPWLPTKKSTRGRSERFFSFWVGSHGGTACPPIPPLLSPAKRGSFLMVVELESHRNLSIEIYCDRTLGRRERSWRGPLGER